MTLQLEAQWIIFFFRTVVLIPDGTSGLPGKTFKNPHAQATS